MARLTRRQRGLARYLYRRGRKRHAPPVDIKAALETGKVETNFRNLRYGSGSSINWRQETAESYPNVNRMSLRGSVDRFYNEARQVRRQTGIRKAHQLAQAVQRSAYPDRYRKAEPAARQLFRSFSHGKQPSRSRSRARRAPSSGSAPSSGGMTLQPSSGSLSALLGAATRPEPLQQAPLPLPAIAAHVPLPKGYQPLEAGPGPGPPPSQTADLLDEIASQSGRSVTVGGSTDTQGAAGGTTGRTRRSSGHQKGVLRRHGYPLSRHGKIIGVPYQGTHTLGNWQSDNAVDIAVPIGTPVLATEDGVIAKTGGHKGTSGRFAGFNITLNGHRDDYFFTHLSRLSVKPGQHVRRGQVIGRSGAANGVSHLHIGRHHGDPRRYG